MPEIELDDKNFEDQVMKSKVPVFVDFWAPWCGPCQSMLPIIEEVAKEYKEDIIKIAKLNIDENKAVPGQYGIMSVPTFMIFKDGQIIDQFVGAHSKDSLKERIDQVLEAND
ncbi:thioredoxin [Candidatus Saccharibacteria bacterium]|nr:thioredoxin [Candidatus Saccharibacteria bacterium]NIV04265.1 thioredoxin [Calditrichia bacterium]NIS39106.1 thioredoxin [Candidatus Saccharibacteria bacterium]NIV72742.1 thioredoxin [Calditrichia bacterium]NIV99917.1 thioredoxin [Candidatus Saccharibacteria bacterium]